MEEEELEQSSVVGLAWSSGRAIEICNVVVPVHGRST